MIIKLVTPLLQLLHMHYLFEFLKILQVPAMRKEWKRVQEAFKAKWNFPNCCGAIDGKHCQIKVQTTVVQNSIITKGPTVQSYLPWLTQITSLFSLMWVVMVELMMVPCSEIQR
jgi:hypothetical protein